MRRLIAWLLQFVLPATVFFAAFPAPAQDSGASGYTVDGNIVDAATNQPIARAEVVLDYDHALLTGNNGDFEFDNVTAGNHQISVLRPGYFGTRGTYTYIGIGGPILGSGSHRPPADQHSILVGPGMPGLTFRLRPAAMIAGQISLSTSDSPDGIRITAYKKRVQNGRPQWALVEEAITNSEGKFHLAGLQPGSYLLCTGSSLDRLDMSRIGATMSGYPSACYPGVTDVSAAGILTLTSGQTAEADFILARQRFYPVTAMVRNSQPGSRIFFQILDSAGRSTGVPARYDAQQQIVHASVPSGAWILVGLGWEKPMSYGRADFQVTGAPAALGISILPMPHVTVTVHEDFNSSGNANAATNPQGQRVYLDLTRDEEFNLGGGVGGHLESEKSSAEGNWIGTVDAEPGRYWVRTVAPQGYVSSITREGVDLTSDPLVIAPGDVGPPIEIVLRNDSGSITGQISEQGSGSSAQAAGEQPQTYIYAIPLFPTSSHVSWTMTRAAGKFTIRNLAPGSYRVVACDSPQEIDFHTPEGLAPWAGKGQIVTVGEDDSEKVQLSIDHTEPAQ